MFLFPNKRHYDVIKNKKVPKGDLFEFSRAAGLLGIKKTSDVIPDCHPLPIEYASITHAIDGLNIIIKVEVHTIYKTGVEVEAMHGAAVTALTIYDMLKPLDKGVEISTIKLEAKKGGKTDFKDQQSNDLRCAVIVCSDGVAAGAREDKSGKIISEKLNQLNLTVAHQAIIPDDLLTIQEKVRQLSKEDYDLILLTGGTGLSPKMLHQMQLLLCLIGNSGNNGSSTELWSAKNALCNAFPWVAGL